MIQALKRARGVLCAAAALALVTVGCNHQNQDKDVMAKVNGYKLLRSELDKAYAVQTAGTPQKLSQQEDQALRLNLLRQLIDVRLQLQKAEKLGIVPTDDEVNDKLNQAKAPYTKEEFEKRLKDAGLTEDEYRQEIRRNLTIEKLRNKEIDSKISITQADIENYYNQNKAQFNLVEPQYDIAHIIVTNQGGAQSAQIPDKAQDDAQARKKIQTAYNRLESGEDFGAIASRYSEDPDTRNNGGELGVVKESQLKNTDAATKEAILKLKPGQFSSIISVVNPETHQPAGYRIVRLNTKRAAGQRELNDPNVQQFIRNQLRNQREQILWNAYDEVLHDGADVRNYYAEQILKEVGQK